MTKNSTLTASTGDTQHTRFRGKKAIAVLAAGLLLAGAGGAYAFWSTTGSGTASAVNKSANGLLVLTAEGFSDGLTPGASQTLTYKASNAGTSTLQMKTLTATVSTSVAGCDASWFTVTTPAGSTSVKKNSTEFLGSGIITFVDSDTVNQDACKSATITLNLTSI